MPFAFSVDLSGMPYIMEDFTFEKKGKPSKKIMVDTSEKPKEISPVNIDAGKHEEILTIVFGIEKEQSYEGLWRNIKLAIEKIGMPAGDNKAKDFLKYYQLEERIIKTKSIRNKPVYVLPGQMELPV